MTNTIFLKDGDRFVPMKETPYEAEDALQALLAEHPEMLVGGPPSDDSRRWLLVSREFGVPDAAGSADRWSVDHLFLDQDGVPTFLEAKRSGDPRSRREVVAQMLDYAANGITNWPADHLRAQLYKRLEDEQLDETTVLTELTGSDEPDVEGFWRRVADNLRIGRIRLLFVADRIPTELRSIIEFLNAQMDPAEVLGIELRQFTDGTTQILSPNPVGHTAASTSRKSTKPAKEPDPFLLEVSRRVAELCPNLKTTKRPTAFVQGRFGHADIHYEAIGTNEPREYALGIHFESSDADLNLRNAEAVRDLVIDIANRHSLSTRIGKWGKKWARAEVLVQIPEDQSSDHADLLADRMKEIVDATYGKLEEMPQGKDFAT